MFCPSQILQQRNCEKMQVLDDGTPLTDGEAFSIIRRNRDLRYAKALPPFCIHSRTHNAGAAMQISYGRQRDNNKNKDAIHKATQDFFAQNTVALHEVQSLFLLRPAMVVYGPTSVYSSTFRPVAPKSSSAVKDEEEESRSNYFAIDGFGPVGSVAHVIAVERELDALDKMGRRAEVQCAEAIRSAVQGLKLSSGSKKLVLSEGEIRSLVSIRPTSDVRVSSLIPNLEGRLATEDDINAFTGAILSVFAQQTENGD